MADQIRQIKWVEGFHNVCVDGFRFQSPPAKKPDAVYLLTHAHSDHTTGLSRDKCPRRIVCSAITRRLVHATLSISPKITSSLCLDQQKWQVVRGGDDPVHVAAFDAGHCPGAVVLLIKSARTGRVVLHVGDFRAHSKWRLRFFAWLQRMQIQSLPLVYLDTTYSRPSNRFCDQADTLDCLRRIVNKEKARQVSTGFRHNQAPFLLPDEGGALRVACKRKPYQKSGGVTSDAHQPGTDYFDDKEEEGGSMGMGSQSHRPLFVVGTYRIGKEKAAEAVAVASGGMCFVPRGKARFVQLTGCWRAGLHTLQFTRQQIPTQDDRIGQSKGIASIATMDTGRGRSSSTTAERKPRAVSLRTDGNKSQNSDMHQQTLRRRSGKGGRRDIEEEDEEDEEVNDGTVSVSESQGRLPAQAASYGGSTKRSPFVTSVMTWLGAIRPDRLDAMLRQSNDAHVSVAVGDVAGHRSAGASVPTSNGEWAHNADSYDAGTPLTHAGAGATSRYVATQGTGDAVPCASVAAGGTSDADDAFEGFEDMNEVPASRGSGRAGEEATAAPADTDGYSTRSEPFDEMFLPYTCIVGFRCTGWSGASCRGGPLESMKGALESLKPKVSHGGRVRIYSVPYSEHSSYDELCAFVEELIDFNAGDVPRIIPTVGAMSEEAAARILQDILPKPPASSSRLARMLVSQFSGISSASSVGGRITSNASSATERAQSSMSAVAATKRQALSMSSVPDAFATRLTHPPRPPTRAIHTKQSPQKGTPSPARPGQTRLQFHRESAIERGYGLGGQEQMTSEGDSLRATKRPRVDGVGSGSGSGSSAGANVDVGPDDEVVDLLTESSEGSDPDD